MAKTKPTEGFLVMPTYTAALEEIADNPELVKEIKLAIIDYGSQGEIDFQSLSSFARCYMRLIMENIDRQKETYRKKRDAGAQGGRGNRKQPETTDKADAKQTDAQHRGKNLFHIAAAFQKLLHHQYTAPAATESSTIFPPRFYS